MVWCRVKTRCAGPLTNPTVRNAPQRRSVAAEQTIVILGGGFGGVYALQYLPRRLKVRTGLRILLIDRENYFLFSPLVHEVATGGVSRESVVTPLREILQPHPRAAFLHATIQGIDFQHQVVNTTAGEISYDYLVLALGAETNFYDLAGVAAHMLPLKSLNDAVAIKNHLITVFERASQAGDPRQRRELLTVVIVGGGSTGVELATELGELVHRDLRKTFPTLDFSEVRLLLLEGMDQILSVFHPSVQERAAAALRRHGIEIRPGARVQEATPDGLRLVGGEFIPARTVIWTAGVKPSGVALTPKPSRAREGRLDVLATLQMPQFPNVFAIGDIAFPRDQPSPPPMTAQVARAEARVCAANLLALIEGAPLKAFRYRSKGMFLSLGNMMAGAELKYIRFFGRLAWIAWRTFYIAMLFGWRNKAKVAIDWFFNLFSSRDISRIK